MGRRLKRMEDSEHTHAHEPGESNGKHTWHDQIPLAIITIIISIITAGAIGLGGRVISGGETSAVLSTQVAQLVDQLKTVGSQNQGQDAILREILVKQGELYTRREAQADREASERRFLGVETRIAELTRRIEVLETNLQFMQQQQVLERQQTRYPTSSRR